MLIDFRKHPGDVPIEADICIIGTGAGGISVAQAFLDTNVRVCMIESGGLEYDDATQNLYDGKSLFFDLLTTRLRYFGGTTNHYSGECSPLDSIDFEARDWVSHSGWPLTHDQVMRYLPAAHQLMDIDLLEYGDELWSIVGRAKPDFDPSRLETYFAKHSGYTNGNYLDWPGPVRFGEKYRKVLENSDNVRVFLYANATRLKTIQPQHVDGLEVKSLDGHKNIVRAKAYIIACGGIETPRLMLVSQDTSPAGLGNEHDNVGRYHIDHPFGIVGNAVARDQEAMMAFSSTFNVGRNKARAILRLTPKQMSQHRLLNTTFYIGGEQDEKSGVFAAVDLWAHLKRWELSDDFASKVLAVLGNLDDVAEEFVRAKQGKEVRIPYTNTFNIFGLSEQMPDRNNRVMLMAETDALDLPKIEIRTRLDIDQKRTFSLGVDLLGTELARLGIGRVRKADWLRNNSDAWREALSRNGTHPSGTTRMSDSPVDGVVNANCRVHSVDNLFIASSSVFPTNGYANPTLNIAVLALRLADHLKTTLM
jgi:choline dehydrogenase-like flavoprotein